MASEISARFAVLLTFAFFSSSTTTPTTTATTTTTVTTLNYQAATV